MKNLIKATIKPKEETYYLVTGDSLDSIQEKSMLSNLFVSLASLGWGAYFSTVISISSSGVSKELETYGNIFCGAGVLFTGLAIWTYCSAFKKTRALKEEKLDTPKKNPP